MARPLRTRNWRRRGRRGQVAAVATLLGLLLVVTFIANFLTTVVPNQMQVNDLNHDIVVENQYGRLAALLSSAGSQGSAGMQFVQPITLGSDGVAPWTAQDGATIGSGRLGSSIAVTFDLLGESTYNPPTGEPTSKTIPAGCTSVSPSTQISCSGSTPYAYNLSANSATLTVSESASGRGALNVTGNNSLLLFSESGSGGLFLQIVGSHDTAYLNGTGSGPTNIWIIGSNDTMFIDTTGSGVVAIHIVGNHDSVTMPQASGSGPLIYSIYGTNDTLGITSDSGSGNIAINLNGFNPNQPTSAQCPYSNLSQYDTIGSITKTGSGGIVGYINNTVGYYANQTGGGGTPIHYQSVTPSTCPFFSQQSIPLGSPSAVGTGPVTQLINSYAPSGEIAYDEGAVVYAQYGAYPVFIDAPSISLTTTGGPSGPVTAASLWVPLFGNLVGSVGGVGTETLDFGLLQTQSYTIGSGGSIYSLNDSDPIRVSVHTLYAEAWDAWLSAHPVFSGRWSCAPAAVCTGVYEKGNPFGTVTIAIPTTNLQMFEIGSSTFSFSLV